jgi:hypothetical protein
VQGLPGERCENRNMGLKVLSEADGKLVIETVEDKAETYYLNPVRSFRMTVEDIFSALGI